MKAFNLLIAPEKNEHQKNKALRCLLSTTLVIALLSHVITHYLLNNKLQQHNATIAKIIANKDALTLKQNNTMPKSPTAFAEFNTDEWLKKRNAVFNLLFKISTPPYNLICFTAIQVSPHSLILMGNSLSALSLTDALLNHSNMRQFNQSQRR